MAIESSRAEPCTIRPWSPEDAAVLLEAYSDAHMESQRPPGLDNLEAVRRLVGSWLESANDGLGYTFATVVGATITGCVSATSVSDRHGTAWISYWTLERHRSRGHATAGLVQLARFCFDELSLHRLELGHRVNNPASCAVAAGAGFLVEGLEREKLRYGDVRYDVELHARLSTDPEPG